MPTSPASDLKDIATIGEIDAVDTILEVLSETTDLRVSLVVKMSEDSWTCCAVRDDAGTGLEVGDKLDVATTY